MLKEICKDYEWHHETELCGECVRRGMSDAEFMEEFGDMLRRGAFDVRSPNVGTIPVHEYRLRRVWRHASNVVPNPQHQLTE